MACVILRYHNRRSLLRNSAHQFIPLPVIVPPQFEMSTNEGTPTSHTNVELPIIHTRGATESNDPDNPESEEAALIRHDRDSSADANT